MDCHNEGKYYGKIIGQPDGPTNNDFANLWVQLAQKYAQHPQVIFGLMNSPLDLTVSDWIATAQTVVQAIRSIGSTNIILVPGTDYSTASSWLRKDFNGISNAEGMKVFKGQKNIIIDFHQV